MNQERQRKSYIPTFIMVTLALIVVTAFTFYNLGKNSVQPAVKVDNTKALQSCITTNVSPLESQAILAPSLYKQGTIEEATNACKAMYPN